MKGYFVYQSLSYLRSLKWIPPVVLYFIWVFIFYTYRGVPILSSYGVTSTVLLFISTWMTMGIFSIDNETEKQLLFVQLSSKLRYIYGKWCVCFFLATSLIIFSIFYPILIQAFNSPMKLNHYSFSLYGHCYFVLTGIFVGSLFSVTALAEKRYSWLGAMLVNIISITSEGMIEKFTSLKWPLFLFPPIGKLLEYFQSEDEIVLKNDVVLLIFGGVVYISLGFLLIIKLFLQKER
ncbi:hypothetical protein [Lederbergia galactosidilytica]|uniref:Uncharacterized protein n=1 Tax=Lederbergia galactosidilytica TaxID=217031 RepID=A0A177ZZ92_9BACI|nr:hypothetical protein [Lederbergia galactosidilytica]KRG12049.1 hypothetical protein ACA30_20645 [Virgibacillus soli]MBP1913514.1 magnesium-transporting ATPase (P-type) [Lederbergia galactosidilytica]OAK72168.1 hypothetical protein ABB05_09000 [Lederbergia galactosidilytica]